MRPLEGLGVLVTRPREQADPLCHALESAGAGVLRLPALDILPVADRERVVEGGSGSPGDSVLPWNLIIFTSTNAVRFGAAWVTDLHPPGAARPAIAAIGPATARALADAGLPVSIVPEGGFDSEALLRHPAVNAIAGRRVLLVKGVGGRDLLPMTLRDRGAAVGIAAVYERRAARPAPADREAVEAAFAGDRIQVITATSSEIAAALLEAATPALRMGYERAHWLVPGARVAGSLRRLGLAAPLLEADTAEDQDLVSALIRWRSRESGA